MSAVDLVVARYNEEIDWLLDVPGDVRIVLINKGGEIRNARLLERIDYLERRDNEGREPDSYLHFLASGLASGAQWTVFTQADPFPHSPDFLNLLESRSLWDDVQPLSCQYLDWKEIPPRVLLEKETGDWVNGFRVRREVFSLRTLGPLGFIDDGIMKSCRSYLGLNFVPMGSNVAEHFLRSAGLDSVADAAGGAEFGRFSYGAIFAVKSRMLPMIPSEALASLTRLSRNQFVHTLILERLWLHLFGEPFLQFDVSAVSKAGRVLQ